MTPTNSSGIWIYKSLLLLVVLLLNLTSICNASFNWYRGCYSLPYGGNIHRLPEREVSADWTPAKCAMKCAKSSYAFAYLTSTTSCFCLGALTQKVHLAVCNRRCPGNAVFRCGGTRTASVYSVYGPYIKKFELNVKPLIATKYQDITLTINIELGADSSRRTGIRSVDSNSFRKAKVTISEDETMRPKRVSRVLVIRGRKGQAKITLRYATEGRKALDITITNPVSTHSDRIYVDVESRMPSELKLWLENVGMQSVCNPETGGEIDSSQNTIFVGEPVAFRAKVISGYNLTFTWDFCGIDERVYEFATENPSCQLTLCKENIQEFVFDSPRHCTVRVGVSNSFGSTTSSMAVTVISPELKDLEVELLPYKWEWERDAALSNPMYDSPFTWPITEGKTEGRESGNTHFEPVTGYDTLPPVSMKPPEKPENHIPLLPDQFLLGKAVNFKAVLFMNNIGEYTQIEIDFGDGKGLQHRLEPFAGFQRKRRDIAGAFMEHGKYLTRWKRRVTGPVAADSHGMEPGPYNPVTLENSDDYDYFDISDEDQTRSGIKTRYGQDCKLEVRFWHPYETPGIYHITVRIFDENLSLFGGVEKPVEILNGTAEFNIRCQKVAELGKSVIFTLSSISDERGMWIWKIIRNSTDQWAEYEQLVQSAYSLKRSFLRRGFYRIEVASIVNNQSSSCVLQVEEVISGLTVTANKHYVQNGSFVDINIKLESGSDVTLEVFSEQSPVEALIRAVANMEWSARFRVHEANCYEFYVRATNPVSTMRSDFVFMCAEESISGLHIELPEPVDIAQRAPVTVSIASGSNVSVALRVLRLSGAEVGYFKKNILTSDATASIRLPAITKSGEYRIVARAENNVFAKTSSCAKLGFLEIEKRFVVSNVISWSPHLVLKRWKISRATQNSGDANLGTYIYLASLKDNSEAAFVGNGVLYTWYLKQIKVTGGKAFSRVSKYYTSNPSFTVLTDRCTSSSNSLNAVAEEMPGVGIGEAVEIHCQVSVEMNTLAGFHASSSSIAREVSNPFVIPQSGVIEIGKSCEFDIKCPVSESGVCRVDFGDGSEPMRITSNSNMKSLSHAFTSAGIHQITLTAVGSDFQAVKVLNSTQVLVQERIDGVQIHGTSFISHGISTEGSWRAVTRHGTNIVYQWSISHYNGSVISSRFSREEEHSYSFRDVGEYLVEVVVYNDVSRHTAQRNIVVEDTAWYFNVKTNRSIVGRPSSFIISTNASKNIVSAKFRNSSKTEKFDLSCLQPKGSYVDEFNVTINQYVISFTYNETGTYKATFSLLSKLEGCTFKKLYTVDKEVIHKPEEKKLEINVINREAVKIEGKNYVPTNLKMTIRANTNYETEIFSWKIYRVDSLNVEGEILLLDVVVGANYSSSLLEFKFEHPGKYRVIAIAHPVVGEGNKTTIELEAEEVITKVWVDKPFSYRFGEVDSCKLKKRTIKAPVQFICDELTLSASSFGTQVKFYFYIRFREHVPGNYSAPTEVIDVIEATSKSTTTNRASVVYKFRRPGVYAITVVASNHLGNKSAEIPYEKPAAGSPRPFLFYAQHAIWKIKFKDTYHVAIHELSTFEVDLGWNRQFLDVNWNMGDGTELAGKSVQHAYNRPGEMTMTVVASNRVDRRTIAAVVRVQRPITGVRVEDMPLTYPARTLVRLRALVQPPKSAVYYTWHIEGRAITVPYVNHIDHRFMESGDHEVEVEVSNNVSSANSPSISVEVQEDIFAYFVGERVIKTNVSTSLEIEVAYGSNVLITWRIDDSKIEEPGFILNYTFTNVGVYNVHANLANKLGTTNILERIFVMDDLCEIPEIGVSKSHHDAFMISKSKPLQLEVDVDINCTFLAKVSYEWKVWKLEFDEIQFHKVIGKELFDIDPTISKAKVLQIPPRVLDYGNYSVAVNVTIDGTIMYQEASTRVDVYPSQPVAKVYGGKVQHFNRGGKVTLDASVSYDPDRNDGGNDDMQYEWECFVLYTPFTPCFKDEYLEGVVFSTTAPPITNSMRALDPYLTVPDRDSSHKKIPIAIEKNESSITFPAEWLVDGKDFVFRVKVTANSEDWQHRSSEETVVVKLSSNALKRIKIECTNCGNNKVSRHVPLQFQASCDDCIGLTNSTGLKYRWSLHEIVDDGRSYYKNESTHCAPPDGDGWLSLKGYMGNASDYNWNDTDSSPDLPPLHNLSMMLLEENSNFVGNTLDEDELRKPFKPKGISFSKNSGISGDMEEGDPVLGDPNAVRYNAFDSDPDDNAPFPVDHPRAARSVTIPYHIIYENAFRERANTAHQASRQDKNSTSGSEDVLEAPSSDSSYSAHGDTGGRDIPKIIPTKSPRPEYFKSPRQADGYRDDSAVDGDLRSEAHYQDSDYNVIELRKAAWGVATEDLLVLRPDSLVEGKTYFVKVNVYNPDDQSLLGQASYYFSVLRGPSYGMCSVLYRITNYLVHCASWKNQQNDNKNDVISRNEMMRYDVKYSEKRDGPKRHIYSGINNEMTFHLPAFDKPAFIHISLQNLDGASTDVCSFLPDRLTPVPEATEFEYLEDAYNKSALRDSRLHKLVAFRDSERIIALCNVILDTMPKDEFINKNSATVSMARQTISNVISALATIRARNIAEVDYIVDAVTRALSRKNSIATKSFLKASNLITKNADAIISMKNSDNPSWRMRGSSDDDIIILFMKARMLLTHVCKESVSQAQARKGTGDAEKNNLVYELVQRLLKAEKRSHESLDKLLLTLVKYRPKVLGPLYANVDGYGFIAQRLDEVVQLPVATHMKSWYKWNVGAVLPENVRNHFIKAKGTADIFALASTMPDVLLTTNNLLKMDDRKLTVTLHDENLSKMAVSELSEPITLALPPRDSQMILPATGLLSRDYVTSNKFAASRLHNRTLHVEVFVESSGNRSFPVSIAIAKAKEQRTKPPRKKDVIRKQVLTRGVLSSNTHTAGGVLSKFVMTDSDFVDGHNSYEVVLWNEQSATSRSRRFDDRYVGYSIRIWWSDCYYWNELLTDWRRDGVTVLKESTSTQTLCSTSHLSTFASSFVPVTVQASDPNANRGIAKTGLFGIFAVLVAISLGMVFYLRLTHGYRCRESFLEMSRMFRPKFNAVGRRLRWYFGPDKKSNAVPVILHDNRKEHKQIYELWIQTSCWPGSGTTSNVYIRMHGAEGQYEARELITPKTHTAREARHENGFAEDDDCSGINDELFITGALTKFVVTFPKSKGTIEKITLWHDHSGECPDWRIDYVTLRDVTHDRRYHFACFDWIAIGKGDRNHSLELRPLTAKPPFRQQIAIKLNALLCNFSSISSIVASPGYGNLSRPQRVIHLISLLFVICGLSTARFWIEWDIFSHDAELPYVSAVNMVYGLVIGVIAALICLPAQLIFRLSKQDDKISVTIEDATESIRGSGFLGDYYPMRYASTIDVGKMSEDKNDSSRRADEMPTCSNTAILPSMGCDYTDDDYNIPSVADTVSDWLVSRSDGNTSNCAGSSKGIDKDWNMHQDGGIAKWKESTSSIDEEIARCMRSPLKRTRNVSNKDASIQKIDNAGEIRSYDSEKNFPVPKRDSEEVFTVSARLQKELDSMLQSGSILAEQYDQMEGIYSSYGSHLQIIPPEIVPCEKLEPIPRDYGALLPRKSRKIAWIYYALAIVTAAVFSLWGGSQIHSHDLKPWFETVAFSFVGLVAVWEGVLIVVFAVVKSAYDAALWRFSTDRVWNLLDNVFCRNHTSAMTKDSVDFYIDSTTYYPTKDVGSSLADETLVEDVRMARQIADRERSRYLRHVRPPKIENARNEKARKARNVNKAVKEWSLTFFLLLNGVILAVALSQRYDDLILESTATKTWLKDTHSFPTRENRHVDSLKTNPITLDGVKTKHDWVKWFGSVVCSDLGGVSDEKNIVVNPSDLLLTDASQNERSENERLRNDDSQNERSRNEKSQSYQRTADRFLLAGNARLTVKLCSKDECYMRFLPQNIKTIINRSDVWEEGSQGAAGIREVQALLREDSEVSNSHRHIRIDEAKNTVRFSSGGFLRGKQVMYELLRRDAVFSAKFEAVLYNPSSHLYSHVVTSAEMTNGDATSSSEAFVSHSVRSVAFTFSPKYSSPANYNAFYLSQMLLLCWIVYCVFHSALSLAHSCTQQAGKTRRADRNEEHNPYYRGAVIILVLDFMCFALCVTFFGLSYRRRRIIDEIIPGLYGYEAPFVGGDTEFPFRDILANTTQLSSVCGLLNFLVLVKVLVILKTYHNFPNLSRLSSQWRKGIGQIFVLFLIFWTTVIVISFCTYLAFMEQYDFSSFVKSLMTVVLQCVTLGVVPVKSNVKFSMIRAKYGTLVTLFFFVVIFVTFRLLLKAFLLAVFRGTHRGKQTKDDSKENRENAIPVKDVFTYLWKRMQYVFYCCLSVLPFQNDSRFANQYPDFSSLGFKANSLNRREKKKLGYTSSSLEQKASLAREVSEEEKNDLDVEKKSKYSLPSEVWLSEVHDQLNELYIRASALADHTDEEEVIDNTEAKQSECRTGEISEATGHSSSEEQTSDGDHDDDYQSTINAKDEVPPLKKQQPKSRSTSSFSVARKSSLHSRGKTDSGISCGSRDSTPGFSASDKKTLRISEENPMRVIPSRDRKAKEFPAKRPSRETRDSEIPALRYGWISDDDVLDRTSVVSAVSLSSFGHSGTPVPPLTTRNLAKHNHNILSRQVSAATGSARSSDKTVRISEAPPRSSEYSCETPDTADTFTQRLWRRISSIKNYFKPGEPPREPERKAHPLRRSRTTAINVRDIPKVARKRARNAADSEASSSVAKSVASTTKLRSLLQSLHPNHVRTIELTRESRDESASRATRAVSQGRRNIAFEGHDESETFCIPGTVPCEDTRRISIGTARSYDEERTIVVSQYGVS